MSAARRRGQEVLGRGGVVQHDACGDEPSPLSAEHHPARVFDVVAPQEVAPQGKAVGILFSVIFFVASSAASAAYLTVSEIFPLEIRAFAIAIFYALGTLVGGAGAPLLFGFLVSTGSRTPVALGYVFGAILMIFAAGCEMKIGVEAAGKSLESISKPLQSK